MIRRSVDRRDCSRQCVSGEGVRKEVIPGRGVTSDRCAWLRLIGGSNFKAIDWRDGSKIIPTTLGLAGGRGWMK